MAADRITQRKRLPVSGIVDSAKSIERTRIENGRCERSRRRWRYGGDLIVGVNKMVQKQTERMMDCETERIEYILEGISSSLHRIANSIEQLTEQGVEQHRSEKVARNEKMKELIDKLFPLD